ncbi:hypothetical protein [Riemerella columbina]|uniref:hypothetical protein n=1 Tax=Riemerella columbina TaxID=103810 RepID=UPI00035ECDA0|nr:hypothetical protein [Riemerella columbina]
MKKKLIILNESGLNNIYTESFEKEGFEVYSLLKDPFVYKKNLKTKFLNIFHRIFLNDKDFYTKDYFKKLNQVIYRRLKNINTKIDYALIFRADYYSKKNIKLLRKLSTKLVAYQYDGWKVSSGILRYKNIFDKIFFFDITDLKEFGEDSLFLTNCYFNDKNIDNLINEYDLFYIGTGTSTRIKYAENLSEKLKYYNIKIIFKIPKYRAEKDLGYIKFTHRSLSYHENINLLKKSMCILDIKFEYHNGLSFRFFEALYYKKKLITNNQSVKGYDFYHPNNIFITDFENLEGIEEFMEKPYIDIDQDIVEKYSFVNWYKYIFGIAPFIEITNPKLIN